MPLVDEVIIAAEASETEENYEAALARWKEANSLQPSARTASRLGRSLMILGRFSEAMEHLERAVVSYPGNAEPLFMLGFTYKRLGRLDDARVTLQRALSLEEWPTAKVVLGEILRQLGETEAARSELQAAVELEPTNSEGWYSLGLTYRDVNHEIAKEYFQKALVADADNSAAYRELGFVLAESGELQEAAQALDSALSRNPEDVWAHCYLSSVFKRQNKFAEAEAESRQAIALMPDEPLFWTNLGDVLALAARWDEAEHSYREALSRDIGNYIANLRYAQFLQRRGWPSRAIDYFERALRADPANGEIKEMLDAARRSTLR